MDGHGAPSHTPQQLYIRCAFNGKSKFVVVDQPIATHFANAAKLAFSIEENISVFDAQNTEVPLECLEYFFYRNPDQFFTVRKESDSLVFCDLDSFQNTLNPGIQSTPNIQCTPSISSTSSSSDFPTEIGDDKTNASTAKTFKEFVELTHYTIQGSNSEEQRIDVVRKSVQYLILKHGHHPSVDQRVALAKELISIYPQLRSKDSDSRGFEHFADPDNHAAGFITNRLKTVNVKLNKTIKKAKDKSKDAKEENKEITDDTFLKTLEELKTLVPGRDVAVITEKTLQFAKLIRQYLETRGVEISLKEAVPRFFDVKDLISLCFDKSFDCGRKKITEWWDDHKAAVKSIFEKSPQNVYKLSLADWPEDVRDFLSLAFLFPSREKKDPTEVEKYQDRVVSGIIKFKKSGVPLPECLATLRSNEPCLIGEGISKQEITKYIIVIDKNTLSPVESNFFDAFDVVFKCYFLFNIQYNANVKHFLRFLDAYVYKISRKITQTSKMRVIYSQIMAEKEALASSEVTGGDSSNEMSESESDC